MSIPSSVGIETINTCNARCIFCPLFQGDYRLDRARRPAQVMEPSLFQSIIDEIAAWPEKPGQILINMDGEPLSDPHFTDRLTVLKAPGLVSLSYLQTNGQLLDEGKAQAILDSGLPTIVFGFDGATKEVYEAHRVRCHYETVLGNIKRLTAMRDAQKSPLRIAIKFVRTKRNQHEVAAAYALFDAFLNPETDRLEDVMAFDWGGAPSTEDDTIFFVSRRPHDAKPQGCEIAATQMIILSDGTVCACCFDYNLDVSEGGWGNVREGGLLPIWNVPRRAALCRALSGDDLHAMPEKCRTCPSLYGFQADIKPQPALQGDAVTVGAYGFTYRFTGKAK